MNSLISVVIPIYNAEKYLVDCIESIVNQSYSDFEIILVNDGSTDSSLDIIHSFEVRDPRIIVIDKVNGGPTSARHVGASVATGQYIMFVDGDDYLGLDAIREICNILKKDADIDIICTGYTRVKEGKKTAVFESYETGLYDKQRLMEEVYPYMMSCHDNIPGKMIRAIWAKIIRKSLLLQILDQIDERIIVGEDSAMSCSCLYLADVVYMDSENTNYFYRYMQKTLSHSYNAMWLKNVEYYSNWMYNFFSECNCKKIKDAIGYEVFSQFYECFDYEIGHCLAIKESLRKRFDKIVESPIGKSVFSQVKIKELPLPLRVRVKVWLIKRKIVWPFAITYYFRNLKGRDRQ